MWFEPVKKAPNLNGGCMGKTGFCDVEQKRIELGTYALGGNGFKLLPSRSKKGFDALFVFGG